MSLSLKVEAFAGTDIKDACAQSIGLATRLGIIVEFDFNGVTVMAKPDVDPGKLVEAFRNEIDSGKSHRIAVVHP